LPRRNKAIQLKAPAARVPLHSIRVHEGLTISQLARLSGLSERTVRDLEHGRRPGKEVTLHRIINALNGNPRRIRSREYTLDEVFPPNQRILF
jgi:transcriptional regulator with XRE-family HTH domain